MANEKRLIDAKEFWNRLQNVVYDIFQVHEKDCQLTHTASVGYYTDTIQEVLKQTKTVDAVEVVHGRWEHDDEYEQWVELYKCSVCESRALEHYRNLSVRSNYCPNCGAKMMDGGNEDG